jgi:hypothetical protein
MDMTRTTITKPSAVRKVVYSRSRMSRKGIPGKNRQNKEAGKNSAQRVVRGGQLRKLRWQRFLILRLFLDSPYYSWSAGLRVFGIFPTPIRPENPMKMDQF